jgi:hypothetical protein
MFELYSVQLGYCYLHGIFNMCSLKQGICYNQDSGFFFKLGHKNASKHETWTPSPDLLIAQVTPSK